MQWSINSLELYCISKLYFCTSLHTSGRITYRDPHNQAVLNRLVREVKGMNSTVLTEHITFLSYLFGWH